MFKFAIFVALVALATAEKASYENYQVLRILPETNEQLDILRQLENFEGSYEFWRGPSFVNQSVDLMVAPSKIAEITELLKTNAFAYETYVPNVQSLIDNEELARNIDADAEFNWKQYYGLDDVYAFLESLPAKYPGKVELINAGKTYEGREIKGVKLSFGANKSAVFIESGIHAREWITVATATYVINQFLTSKDAKIRQLAESFDWYIVPSVNPDGYVYTHTNDRLWRKTRSPGNRFCKGTDANRNWGYQWMTAGASSNPCAETYAGNKPFSEIETKSLSEYIASVSDKVFTYISFHSYSQLLLFPYGHTSAHLENYDELYAIAGKAVTALAKRYGTQYTYGNIAEAIYPASGSSIDHVKAVLKVPLTYTYEFRDTGRHGFILPPNQIIPNGEEIIDSLLAKFEAAAEKGYPKPL